MSDGYYYLNNSENWVYETGNTVPVGRGFLVKANAAGQTVTLNPQSKGNSADKGQYLCLAVGEEKVYVKLNEGVSMPLFDMKGQHASLYLLRDRQPFAMLVRDGASTLDMCFEAHHRGEHTLTVDTQGLALGYLHLIDNLTGADVDLLATPQYTFYASASDYASRFRLVFDAAFEPAEESSSFAYVSHDQIIIAGLNGDDGAATLQIIDATGRVLSCRAAVHLVSIPTTGMSSGVYVLRLITEKETHTQRIVLQ